MTSPPRTPSSCTRDRRFKNISKDCEWVEQYRPGGLHPVTLGDTFHGGRYKVIRKLGEGSFSTVWLVVSTSAPKYAALKIVAAKHSAASTEVAVLLHLSNSSQPDPNAQHVTMLLDSFQHEGPNGVHQCLVFELMGASVASLLDVLPSSKGERWNADWRYPKAVVKEILLQTLRALSFVHKNGLVHSDVQPGNLLFAIDNLSGVEEQQLKQDEAETTVPVQRIDGKVDKWAPRNIYLREPLHDHVKLNADLYVKLSDFGVAFFLSDPPASPITPIALRAPELILKRPFDSSIDIWSFGCLMYEFLTGEVLFALMIVGFGQIDEDDADDDHLCQLNDIIRPLPESLMSAWPRSSKWFAADHNHLQPNQEVVVKGNDETGAVCKSEDVDKDKDKDKEPYVHKTLEQRFAAARHPDIDDEEAAIICGLIRRILAYDPAERPSAKELLQHPWFLK